MRKIDQPRLDARRSKSAHWPERGWATPTASDTNRGARLRRWIPVAVYALVGLAFVVPLLRRGYLFSFDMAFGPNERIPAEAFGLGSDFGRRLPTFIVIAGLSRLVDAEWIGKAILFAIPFFAGLGMHRLAPTRSMAGRYFAGLLYAVNPFVYERMLAGHWHILLGYALVPWALRALIGWARGSEDDVGDLARSQRWRQLAIVTLWLGLIGIVSFVVATELLVLTLAAVLTLRRTSILKKLRSAALLVGTFSLANATWIVAGLAKADELKSFTRLDFRAFLVRGSSPIGATGNVVRLTGFFRDDFRSPVLNTPAGTILLLVVLGLVGLGFVSALRGHRMHRRIAWLFLGLGVVAAVGALGERAPLIGPILGWLYPRIPGMEMLRESQKLVGLLALVYAIFGSLGVEAVVGLRASGTEAVENVDVVESEEPRGQSAGTGTGASAGTGALAGAKVGVLLTALAIVALPLAWTPNFFWGAGGRITVSQYPDGWYEADSVLKADGAGRAVVFPWHVHLPLSFAEGKTNVNPAGDFFNRDLIQSGKVEFPGFMLGVDDPVDDYIRNLIAHGSQMRDMGAQLSPLGADAVILLKEGDWEEYRFLDEQVDLVKVLENDSLVVYRAPGLPGSLTSLSKPVPTLIGTLPDPRGTGYLDTEDPGVGSCGRADGRPVQTSPITWEVPGAGCWLIPEPESANWSPDHLTGPADGHVATAVRTGGGRQFIYRPAIVAIAGHVITLLTLIGAAFVALAGRRRRQRRHRRSTTVQS